MYTDPVPHNQKVEEAQKWITEARDRMDDANQKHGELESELERIGAEIDDSVNKDVSIDEVQELLDKFGSFHGDWYAATYSKNIAEFELKLSHVREQELRMLVPKPRANYKEESDLRDMRGELPVLLKEQSKYLTEYWMHQAQSINDNVMAECKARVLRKNHPSKLAVEISAPCKVYLVCIDLYSDAIITNGNDTRIKEFSFEGATDWSFCRRIASKLTLLLYNKKAGEGYTADGIHRSLVSYCKSTETPDNSGDNMIGPIIGLYKPSEGVYALLIYTTTSNVQEMIGGQAEVGIKNTSPMVFLIHHSIPCLMNCFHPCSRYLLFKQHPTTM